jgi:hypothetical protein
MSGARSTDDGQPYAPDPARRFEMPMTPAYGSDVDTAGKGCATCQADQDLDGGSAQAWDD